MMREEFERIAGAEISVPLYEDIEKHYEKECRKKIVDKREYIGRIYGYKNSAKSIAAKHALFIIRRNRDDHKGFSWATPERLYEMDELLIDRVTVMARTSVLGCRAKLDWHFDLYEARLNGRKAFVGEAESPAEDPFPRKEARHD
jgi:hypothetical protein